MIQQGTQADPCPPIITNVLYGADGPGAEQPFGYTLDRNIRNCGQVNEQEKCIQSGHNYEDHIAQCFWNGSECTDRNTNGGGSGRFLCNLGPKSACCNVSEGGGG